MLGDVLLVQECGLLILLKHYLNLIQTNVIEMNLIQTNVIEMNLIQTNVIQT